MYVVFDLWLFLAICGRLPALMVTAWVFSSFGAMTVIPPDLIGGISLPVTTVAFLAVIVRMAFETESQQIIFLLFSVRRLGILMAYTIVAVLGAIVLPPIMGHILIFPMSVPVLGVVKLVPSFSNITQALYVFISSATALAYGQIANRPALLGSMRSCFLYGAGSLVATGLLDMVFAAFGRSDWLDVFRLAQYAYLVDVEIVDVRRVVGLMPEASTFGSSCVFWCSVLFFTRDFFPKKTRFLVVMPLAFACGGFAILSTSSTAYLGLFVTAAIFALDTFWSLVSGTFGERLRAAGQLCIAVSLGILVSVYVLIDSNLSRLVWSVFESVVLDKSYSSSFEERSAWTEAGVNAFWSSFGLGVGVGSVRTSNLFVNIVASTGVLGTVLFISFLFVFFTSQPESRRSEYRAMFQGLKLATLPTFAAAAVAGTTPDFGPFLGAAFGIVVGLAAKSIGRKNLKYSSRWSGLRRFTPITKVL